MANQHTIKKSDDEKKPSVKVEKTLSKIEIAKIITTRQISRKGHK